jgi:hypothetical protein
MSEDTAYQTDAYQGDSFQIETQEEPPAPPATGATSFCLSMEMKVE